MLKLVVVVVENEEPSLNDFAGVEASVDVRGVASDRIECVEL
jgi:hypothetical protein